jgi:hypothetical protein
LYNLSVDTAHTFYVGEGQWLVHNTNFSGGCPTLKLDLYNPNAVLARSQKLKDVLEAVQTTRQPPAGYRGGGVFNNQGRNGEYVLPKTDSQGNPITYKEYDVNPYTPGVNRGPERLVIGSDGRAYSTADHYKTYAPVNFSGNY